MTRARLIEKVIADYLESVGWRITTETGVAFLGREQVRCPHLADAIDAEFDRIARETATR